MPKIIIVISKGEEKWFAECEHLDVYATGDTPIEALQEFQGLYKQYKAHYDKLTAIDAGSKVQILKQRFKEFG